MKPDIDDVLIQTTQVMLQSYAPQATNSYLTSQIAMSAMLLSSAVEEWDRAAQRRVEENRAIRGLFRQAAGLGLDPGLAARLAALAEGDDADLRISALEAANMVLRAALIDLQAAVEGRADAGAAALNDAIWSELAASTERRRFAGASF
jgi:hypothetical protein